MFLLFICCIVAQAEFSQLYDYNIRDCTFHLQQKQIINAKPQKICKVFFNESERTYIVFFLVSLCPEKRYGKRIFSMEWNYMNGFFKCIVVFYANTTVFMQSLNNKSLSSLWARIYSFFFFIKKNEVLHKLI